MYTQCPDCNTAFRVTAPVLQEAGGRVVCAGCGLAFNALERLTEDPPATMAPDDSKRVLETLDELTGPHQIRIEDTGVEWRVIDEDDPDEDFGMQTTGAPDPDSNPDRDPDPVIDPRIDDTGSVRWYIEETPGEPQVPLQLAHVEDTGDLQRYDDNTPLPDDFVEEREPSIPQRRAEDHIEPRSPEADAAQVDLALGEPDDWMDLLDEVGTARNAGEAKPEHDKSVDADDDTVERLSLESHAAAAHAEADDLAGADACLAPGGEPEADGSFPSDIDTQFDLQAIEMGIDLTGNRELSLEEPVAAPATAAARDPGEAPDEPQAEAPAPQRQHEPGIETSEPVLAGADAKISAEEAEERNRERAFEEELATAYALGDEPAAITATTGKAAAITATTGKAATPAKEPARPEHFVPAPTEEELTVNMQIDQDLIRLAKHQNVFTSGRKLEDLPLVETIIMEGETVRTALEAEFLSERKADAADVKRSAGELTGAKPAAPGDTDLLMESWIKTKDTMRGGRRRTDPPSYRMMVGVAVLGLLLAAQVVHAYRDSLATYSAFDKTVGSLYRLLGDPVIPDWNVKGWQFETTSGSTDETGRFLTISSSILNGTARSLPYPLLHVSLTDRWEEIIGSTLLEPSEYLANGADASNPVAAGRSFAAVVRIDAPSPDATGFKLNLCYREPDSRLRCATEDFKD